MRSNHPRGFVRIISGKWRNRHLPIIKEKQLRPTPDRVRETLFNWLIGKIEGTRCLDLFAGSGALGFEALSRGAKHTTFIDVHEGVVKMLEQQAIALQALADCDIIKSDSLRWLNQHQKSASYDLIFLDPPFSSSLLEPCIGSLMSSTLIRNGSLIYIESPMPLSGEMLPKNWQIIKQQQAGEVAYHLIKVEGI